ncbi:MAG: sulfatase [Opitutaceae bacterium]|nr:sulfatase [Opitutaceae bacterium]
MKSFGRLVAIVFLHGVAAAAAASHGTRPNIVFILADDHTTQAISCYGSKLARTPQIDRIAAGGMRFDHAFCTESICSPSRAAIMTGKYGHITGAKGWTHYDRVRNQTFPEALQAAGYHTALFGKYHMGENPPGFDDLAILKGQGRYRDPQLHSKGGMKGYPGHVSDVITDLSLAWLEKRDPNRPFLLCIHHKATHMPWTPADRSAKNFLGVTLPEPPTLLETSKAAARSFTRTTIDKLLRWNRELAWPEPAPGLDDAARTRSIYQQYLRSYLATAQGMDENIGRVLDYLDREGLAENTIVVYASDQGFLLGEHGWFDKRWMLEESLRLPFIVRYPKLVRPGSSSSAMALNIDFAPTLLDLAGAPPLAGAQGRSLRPILAGATPAGWRKEMYYRYYPEELGIPPQLGLRTDRYKLIHYDGLVSNDDGTTTQSTKGMRPIDEWELFDLKTDPGEHVNLYHAPAAQTLVTELKSRLARLRAELGDPEATAQRTHP